MKKQKSENEKMRDVMIKAFYELRQGEIGLAEAKTQANLMGKTLSSAKSEMEYMKFAGKTGVIDFFESKNVE